MMSRSMAPSGDLGLRLIKGGLGIEPQAQIPLAQVVRRGFPIRGLDAEVSAYRCRNLFKLLRGLKPVLLARALGIPTFYGMLELLKIDGLTGERIDYGLVGMRVVTTAGITYIAADIAGGASDSNLFKFHGIGTGNTAEAVGDTALVTELTTEYNPNSTRATGTQSSSAGVYTTPGTNTLDSGTPAIVEHGVFTATSAGTLLDRTVFSAINLTGASADSLLSTYALTLVAGS
ncbi:MAG TPA: hypothetical protein VFA63_14995 [Pseudonocardiaceae bacterium]|nr:hypothetical protein [Pseudonocardiaceae bacterium]